LGLPCSVSYRKTPKNWCSGIEQNSSGPNKKIHIHLSSNKLAPANNLSLMPEERAIWPFIIDKNLDAGIFPLTGKSPKTSKSGDCYPKLSKTTLSRGLILLPTGGGGSYILFLR